jgi:DNA-binding MarR family transcriptional regulator
VAELRELAPELVRAASDLRVTVGRIARRLRQAHAVGELTLSEVSVLYRLEHQGATSPGVLADEERVRPQAMGATLAALEQRELVQRHPDEIDRRRVTMSVTAAGRAVLVDRRSESTQRLARAIGAEFSPAEQRKLLAALPLLDRLAERL